MPDCDCVPPDKLFSQKILHRWFVIINKRLGQNENLTRMETEDFHRRLRVGIIGGFKAKLKKPQMGKEGSNDGFKVAQI